MRPIITKNVFKNLHFVLLVWGILRIERVDETNLINHSYFFRLIIEIYHISFLVLLNLIVCTMHKGSQFAII